MHWGWAYDGVNGSIPRNTGPECVNYLSTARHIIESLVMVPAAMLVLRYGISKLPPLHVNYNGTDRIVIGKQLLLITMASLLGLEMGFKLCTRTVIFILNPCHITSMLQVYLLAAKPSKWTTTLFRIHINFLNGPLLAFLFPEHDSRRITFELPTYYIQHGLMFVIPIYLLRQGGPYVTEKVTDLSYSICAYGIFILYHYGFLEIFAVLAEVNLNHMICPAILDPFQGTNYRLMAATHQALLCPIVAKSVGYLFTPSSIASNVISTQQHTKSKGISSGETTTTMKDATHRSDSSDQVQNASHSNFEPSNIKTKTNLHNECNTKNANGKRIENGCDIGKNGSTPILSPNDSNKKGQ